MRICKKLTQKGRAKAWAIGTLCALFLISLAAPTRAEGKKRGIYEAVQLHEREEDLVKAATELEDRFLERGYRFQDPGVEEWLGGIGRRLVPEVKDPYINYRFYILQDPTPNAFGLPDGQIYVTTGMLAVLENEAQLAGLLAHEMIHVAGHHGIVAHRSVRKKAIIATVINSLGAFDVLGDLGDLAVNLSNQFLLFSLRGYQRNLEDEADRGALRQLREAGYDMWQMPRAFEILRRNPEGEIPVTTTKWNSRLELQSRTHTMNARLSHLLEEADVVVGREDYQLITLPIALMTVSGHIRKNCPRTAVDLARRLVQEVPANPEAWLALGDALQALGPRAEVPDQQALAGRAQSNARKRVKQTRDERNQELLKTPQGKVNFERNMNAALASYGRALDLNGRLPEVYLGLGHIYQKLKRPRESARAFMTFLKLRPDSSDRILVLDELKRIRKALKGTNGGIYNAREGTE